MKPRNDRAQPLSAFCLELEKHRRAPDGRVRNAEAFVQFYFPRRDGGTAATDRIFVHLPREVRGPVLAGWRIRGLKAALRDDDGRVKDVVLDALEAGDVDAAMFEEGIGAEVLIDFAPLEEWWQFWRGAALPNAAVQKALAAARTLKLIDDAWFLENIAGRGGKLKGTDAVCDTITKDDVTAWIRAIHASGNGSPSGLVAARGWENILAKTAPDALLGALDAFARSVQLVRSGAREEASGPAMTQVAAPELRRLSPLSPSQGLRGGQPLDLGPLGPLGPVTPGAAPNGGWSEESFSTTAGSRPPTSMPGEIVRDDEIQSVPTPHRPPPLPK